MYFIGDLHVHSKFSRATSKNLDLENLYVFSQLKGITVVGTGDCTHPGWFSEISEKLVQAEQGLFRLRRDIEQACDRQVPKACRGPVRFILQSEISNIYKKDGKTRKNHNLVFFPDRTAAGRFNQKLDAIGNIKSDGRPILGLDARNLLEILIEVDENAFFVPAHIWTPWFSLLGSKSGFDSIEACFEDLSDHIFAVETGLSSDPEMNWRVSQLDRMTLISNSDAHSPGKLGREANMFNTELDYQSIKKAIAAGDGKSFTGTIEFYPEQGKYHFDGHRKCKVRLDPRETRKKNGLCPVCGKALTLGVAYRVEMLADRKPRHHQKNEVPFLKLVPLVDILSEIFQVGPGSKKVLGGYDHAPKTLGPEFSILKDLDAVALDRAGIPFLAEAIMRMRSGDIQIDGGYDGEFGVVKIFSPDEREKLSGQPLLFQIPTTKKVLPQNLTAAQNTPPKEACKADKKQNKLSKKPIKPNIKLNNDQERAVLFTHQHLLIVAGPGTGKTFTLTHRIAHLIDEQGIGGQRILAVTFTNKAAREIRSRLVGILGTEKDLPEVGTFHAFCFQQLKSIFAGEHIRIIPDRDRDQLVKEALFTVKSSSLPPKHDYRFFRDGIIRAKQNLQGPEDLLEKSCKDTDSRELKEVYTYYQDLLQRQHLYDFEDLIFLTARQLEQDNSFKKKLLSRFRHIFVDEYQDINYGQYRLIKALTTDNGNLCAIGDPGQPIYGFRGSDRRYFNRFTDDFPGAAVIRLTRNYRSSNTILKAAHQVIKQDRNGGDRLCLYSEIEGEKTLGIMKAASEKAEAVTIGKLIENMVGGTGFHSIDFGKVGPGQDTNPRSFSDFAILYRTNRQGPQLNNVLSKAGIPCQLAQRDSWMDQKDLAELIVLLSVIEGSSYLKDFERIRKTIHPGISRKTAQQLKTWYLKNDLTIDALRYSVRQFPVAGLTRSRQDRLYAFLGRIHTLQGEMEGFSVKDKLVYLIKNTRLSGRLHPDASDHEGSQRLLDYAIHFGYDAQAFLTDLALSQDPDTVADNVEKVALMSMHASKGLEFPIVFIAGCDHQRVPYCRGKPAPEDLEEERRLFYVAVTRAQEKIFFSYALKGRLFGRTHQFELSPFVKTIEKKLLAEYTVDKPVQPKPKQDQMQLF
ncbi:MAG: Endonuclease Q, cleaves 5' to damaged DNA bases / ATP-dependent DNA helicase UvrD/PcrA-like protein [Olavius algarvensis Delta 4 endosymbiont]|nr:MAG: Endonuclease Q, cleaves 5' to damaged DNA bases / ATP-dependent DNA helicase UvrD/PcrA-like protein [Olavius algarvensis Delta 4 endosymbiont]